MRFEPDREGIARCAYEARHDLLEETGGEATELMRANAPEDTGELKRQHKTSDVDSEAEMIYVIFDVNHAVPLHEGWERYEYGRDESGEGQGALVASFRGDPWARRTLDEMSAALG